MSSLHNGNERTILMRKMTKPDIEKNHLLYEKLGNPHLGFSEVVWPSLPTLSNGLYLNSADYYGSPRQIRISVKIRVPCV